MLLEAGANKELADEDGKKVEDYATNPDVRKVLGLRTGATRRAIQTGAAPAGARGINSGILSSACGIKRSPLRISFDALTMSTVAGSPNRSTITSPTCSAS